MYPRQICKVTALPETGIFIFKTVSWKFFYIQWHLKVLRKKKWLHLCWPIFRFRESFVCMHFDLKICIYLYKRLSIRFVFIRLQDSSWWFLLNFFEKIRTGKHFTTDQCHFVIFSVLYIPSAWTGSYVFTRHESNGSHI